eukprot:CAMPEP_0178835744 /NCGR_PEP_ID=MMETSP0746-20121128/11795_1 /TAXON_ID=913974 /ORGANISM="Nitzschia punctata, Strain CCMP561" /LENGTH=825 /DNA_ID=CAMNT_0020498349 /DNA_START=125 /DNA_END=2602 /DNA_ORIENTATION=-
MQRRSRHSGTDSDSPPASSSHSKSLHRGSTNTSSTSRGRKKPIQYHLPKEDPRHGRRRKSREDLYRCKNTERKAPRPSSSAPSTATSPSPAAAAPTVVAPPPITTIKKNSKNVPTFVEVRKLRPLRLLDDKEDDDAHTEDFNSSMATLISTVTLPKELRSVEEQDKKEIEKAVPSITSQREALSPQKNHFQNTPPSLPCRQASNERLRSSSRNTTTACHKDDDNEDIQRLVEAIARCSLENENDDVPPTSDPTDTTITKSILKELPSSSSSSSSVSSSRRRQDTRLRRLRKHSPSSLERKKPERQPSRSRSSRMTASSTIRRRVEQDLSLLKSKPTKSLARKPDTKSSSSTPPTTLPFGDDLSLHLEEVDIPMMGTSGNFQGKAAPQRPMGTNDGRPSDYQLKLKQGDGPVSTSRQQRRRRSSSRNGRDERSSSSNSQRSRHGSRSRSVSASSGRAQRSRSSSRRSRKHDDFIDRRDLTARKVHSTSHTRTRGEQQGIKDCVKPSRSQSNVESTNSIFNARAGMVNNPPPTKQSPRSLSPSSRNLYNPAKGIYNTAGSKDFQQSSNTLTTATCTSANYTSASSLLQNSNSTVQLSPPKSVSQRQRSPSLSVLLQEEGEHDKRSLLYSQSSHSRFSHSSRSGSRRSLASSYSLTMDAASSSRHSGSSTTNTDCRSRSYLESLASESLVTTSTHSAPGSTHQRRSSRRAQDLMSAIAERQRERWTVNSVTTKSDEPSSHRIVQHKDATGTRNIIPNDSSVMKQHEQEPWKVRRESVRSRLKARMEQMEESNNLPRTNPFLQHRQQQHENTRKEHDKIGNESKSQQGK